jgi:hypothetical protein
MQIGSRPDPKVASIWRGALVLAVFFVLTVLGSWLRYRECRAHGFSAFYCVGSR